VRTPDDLVVDVREVHHLLHFPAGEAQCAPEQILEQERAEVPEVSRIVDRRTARVEADLPAIRGSEWLDTASERVVEEELGHPDPGAVVAEWPSHAWPGRVKLADFVDLVVTEAGRAQAAPVAAFLRTHGT